MAALTTSKQTPIRGDFRVKTFPLKTNAKVYAGGFACIETSSGYLVDATDTAGLKVVGIVIGEGQYGTPTFGAYDATGLASGAIQVPVAYECEARVVGSSLAQTSVGANLEVSDNQTLVGSSTNHVKAGKCIEYISATECVIFVPGLSDLS